MTDALQCPFIDALDFACGLLCRCGPLLSVPLVVCTWILLFTPVSFDAVAVP